MATTIGMCGVCHQQQGPAGSCYSLRSAVHSPGEVGPGSWDTQQWWAAQALGKVWAVTCASTRTLGSSGSNRCLPLGSEITAVARTCLWSSCRWCPAVCEHKELEAPMEGPPLSSCTTQQWTLASMAAPGFFLDSLPASCDILAPSGCLHAAKPSPLPRV